MKRIIFSTGNAGKFLTAKHVCEAAGIAVEQKNIDIPEIQDENPEKVACDKAAKAFLEIGQPLVVSDDSWAFAGLKGFPGVYMHSMNEWFTPEDFLRLVLPLKNRQALLTQYLVYTDGAEQKVFTQQTECILLKEIRGTSKHPSHTIISVSGENGLSIAEVDAKVSDRSTRESAQVWHDFTAWYQGS